MQPDGLPVLFSDLGMANLDQSTLAQVIVEVDKDGSGEIEFDEFAALWVVLSNAKKSIIFSYFIITR